LSYMDDIYVLGSSKQMVETIAEKMLCVLVRAGLRPNAQKFTLIGNKYVRRPCAVVLQGHSVPLATADFAARVLGVALTASGATPQLFAARRGAALAMAARVTRRMKGLSRLTPPSKCAVAFLESAAMWAVELLPPAPDAMRRWSGFQVRLFARWLASVPDENLEPNQRWRLRMRESRAALESLGVRLWHEQHARRYYRAAWRVAQSTGFLRAFHSHRGLWYQRTMQMLGGGCGPQHGPGRPTRWEFHIAQYHNEVHHRNWIDDPASFTPLGEDSFARWLLSQPPA